MRFFDWLARDLRFALRLMRQTPVVSGVAMLTGSVAGGFIAQQVSLGAPFVLRGVILAAMFAVAFSLNDLFALIIGGVLYAAATVMREAARIADENASFV